MKIQTVGTLNDVSTMSKLFVTLATIGFTLPLTAEQNNTAGNFHNASRRVSYDAMLNDQPHVIRHLKFFVEQAFKEQGISQKTAQLAYKIIDKIYQQNPEALLNMTATYGPEDQFLLVWSDNPYYYDIEIQGSEDEPISYFFKNRSTREIKGDSYKSTAHLDDAFFSGLEACVANGRC